MSSTTGVVWATVSNRSHDIGQSLTVISILCPVDFGEYEIIAHRKALGYYCLRGRELVLHYVAHRL